MPQSRQGSSRRRTRPRQEEPEDEQTEQPQDTEEDDVANEPKGDDADDRDQEDDGGDGASGLGGVGDTVVEELKSAIRDAALEVLRPAASQAASSAAKYAVSKGPELVTKNVLPAIGDRGGAGGLAQEALSKGSEALSGAGGVKGLVGKVGETVSKPTGGGGGGEGSGWGHNRRMPIQQDIFVSVPIKRAYTGWTEYKRWPEYMHRANQSDVDVDEDKLRVKVTEKMWGFTRPFTAEVLAQRPDEYIKWNSTEGTRHTGIINFHELGPRLT
jgi:polyketide cyclase/dehydrase/lipid transport protein